jgi:hypothetical protein
VPAELDSGIQTALRGRPSKSSTVFSSTLSSAATAVQSDASQIGLKAEAEAVAIFGSPYSPVDTASVQETCPDIRLSTPASPVSPGPELHHPQAAQESCTIGEALLLGGRLSRHEHAPLPVERPRSVISRAPSPLPSLRIPEQDDESVPVPVAAEIVPEKSSLSPPASQSQYLSPDTTTHITGWLEKMPVGRPRSPSPARDMNASSPLQHSVSPVSKMSPSAITSFSSPISSPSSYASEGEASFVLGEDPNMWLTLEDSQQTMFLVAAFARAFVSLYLDRGGAPNDNPDATEKSSSASSSSGTGNATATSQATTPISTKINTAGKRPLPDDDEQGNKKRRAPKIPLSPTQVGPDTKLMACPYAKYDPQRYSASNSSEVTYRKCSSSFLVGISRVKQHLYRNHRRPEHHCPCCFTSFETREALDQHIVERTCERRPSPFEEKMTPDQLNKIKRRDFGRKPEDAWFDIFRILFPGAPLPSDPYVESRHSNMVQDFMAYFHGEGRHLLASEINWRMFGHQPTTPEYTVWADTVLSESINVLIQELENRFRRTPSPS